MFMFAIVGVIYYKSVDEARPYQCVECPIAGSGAFSIRVSVLVELALNKGGLLVWDYRWWNRGFIEVLPIFVFGYLWFYLAAKFAIERRTMRARSWCP